MCLTPDKLALAIPFEVLLGVKLSMSFLYPRRALVSVLGGRGYFMLVSFLYPRRALVSVLGTVIQVSLGCVRLVNKGSIWFAFRL